MRMKIRDEKIIKYMKMYCQELSWADELNLDIPCYDEDRRELIEWYVQNESCKMLRRIIKVISDDELLEREIEKYENFLEMKP